MKKYEKEKNTLFLILMVLTFVLPSFARVRVIPEISPSLSDEDVLDLTYKETVKKIIKHNAEFVFITLKGEIFRWDPASRMIDFLYHFNAGIEPEVFHQGRYVILKQRDAGTYIIFDLDEMKETALLENLNIEKIVGLDRECIVYLAGAGELKFYNYRSRTLLNTAAFAGDPVYNCEFKEDRTFILSGSTFRIFDKKGNTVKTLKLKHKAGSDFLLDDRWIYYGSDKRELIKFSTTSGRTRWRFETGGALKIKPLKIGPYIAVVPEDNNIYFFNSKGTLYWWEKLDSARLLPPEALKENVAVFLWDKKVKFFNYKKKLVTTYPLNRQAGSNPVSFGEYIYIVSEDHAGEGDQGDGKPVYKRVSKIGNHYGVEIKTRPEYIKPVGKSITFDLMGINLIEPQYRVKIFISNNPGPGESAGNKDGIFEKVIAKNDKPSFVWIPGDTVEYRMVITVNALNKKELTIEETFHAVDIEKILQRYYYTIQTQSDTDSLK